MSSYLQEHSLVETDPEKKDDFIDKGIMGVIVKVTRTEFHV